MRGAASDTCLSAGRFEEMERAALPIAGSEPLDYEPKIQERDQELQVPTVPQKVGFRLQNIVLPPERKGGTVM